MDDLSLSARTSRRKQIFFKSQESLTDLLQANFLKSQECLTDLSKEIRKECLTDLSKKIHRRKKFEKNVLQTCAQVCKTFH